jgi:hypothetical protein
MQGLPQGARDQILKDIAFKPTNVLIYIYSEIYKKAILFY